MEEMLICLHMRHSIQSPIVLPALTLHVPCVDQPLEVPLKKHVWIWLHRMEIREKIEHAIFTLILTNLFMPFRFYLMVYAFSSYTDGNLQLFGNVQSVVLDGECTGYDCQTEEGVTTPSPPRPPGPGR